MSDVELNNSERDDLRSRILATGLDLPHAIIHIADEIHRTLPSSEAKAFFMQVMQAFQVITDPQTVTTRFIIIILTSVDGGVIQYADALGKSLIRDVAALYVRRLAGNEPTLNEWQAIHRFGCAMQDHIYSEARAAAQTAAGEQDTEAAHHAYTAAFLSFGPAIEAARTATLAAYAAVDTIADAAEAAAYTVNAASKAAAYSTPQSSVADNADGTFADAHDEYVRWTRDTLLKLLVSASSGK